MIRDARFSDIKSIIALLQSAYLRSHYAADPRVSIDVAETKRLLFTSIQRHGGTNGGACWVTVAESDGEIRGLMLATLARVYVIGNALMATDVLFVASPDVDPADPLRLAKGMVEWARANPKVTEVRCGTTGVIHDDPMKAGRIWERLGMTHYGEIWRLPCQE